MTSNDASMPREPTLLLCDVPTEILEASHKLSLYFRERGFEKWMLGGCQNRVEDRFPVQPAPPKHSEAAEALDINIKVTLDYYDTEFPLNRYPDREGWPVSQHAGGITVGQLRALSLPEEIQGPEGLTKQKDRA